MKARFVFALSTIALLCSFGTGCSKERLDIVIQGPWILYQDTQFDKDGKQVPVLVAIAPTDALSYQGTVDNPDHPHLHHIPQVSAGDGYWIKTPGIYCLVFDGECAQRHGDSLQHHDYADPHLLAVKFPPAKDGSSHWDWASAVGTKNTALIIPMPDSYSSEGTWFMRFASTFDGTGKAYVDSPSNEPRHSIGLVLHYDHGPKGLNLFGCGPKPTAGNCNIKPDPSSIPRPSLDNTGTLSVVMKAPEHESACDWHVRFAYHTMLALIDPNNEVAGNHNTNQNIGYIEPARDENADGTAEYEVNDDPKKNYCLSNDPQAPQPLPSQPAPPQPATSQDGHANLAMEVKSHPMENVLPFTGLSAVIDQAFNCSPNDKSNNSPGSAQAVCGENDLIKVASKGLDPDLPRISQLRWIITLLYEVKQDIPKEDKYKMVNQAVAAALEADPGKSANDCLAAQVQVEP
jgi:hypothetical protein